MKSDYLINIENRENMREHVNERTCQNRQVTAIK